MNSKNNKKTGKFGLPREVKYCTSCNVTHSFLQVV